MILRDHTNILGMYFTYIDIENHISLNGIPALSKEIQKHLQDIHSSIIPPPSFSTAPTHPTPHSFDTKIFHKSFRNGNNDNRGSNDSSMWKEKKKLFQHQHLPHTTIPLQESNICSNRGNSWIEEKKKDKVAFVATKIERKTGIEQTMNEIRVLLNKLTPKNYDSQREKLFEKMKETEIDSAHILAQFIFNLASSNTFQGELYARLYTDIINQNEPEMKKLFQDILHEFLLHFKQSIQTDDVEYVDPDIDYDKYCKYVKENDRKKAITRFAFHLYKNQIVPETVIIELIDYFLLVLKEIIDRENKINETEEMVEIIYIFITMGKEGGGTPLLQHVQWEMIMKEITDISQMKVKEHKGFSSRALFKIQSLIRK